MATTGLVPSTRISSGVMIEPPPMPVVPTSTPTPRPNSRTIGSMRVSTIPDRLSGLLVQRVFVDRPHLARDGVPGELRRARQRQLATAGVLTGIVDKPDDRGGQRLRVAD